MFGRASLKLTAAAMIATSRLLAIGDAPDAPPAPSQDSEPPPSAAWLHLETRHFTIWSEVGPSSTTSVASELETMWAVVERVAGGLEPDEEPLDVFVFRSQPSMASHFPGGEMRESLAGLYISRGDRRALLLTFESLGSERHSVVLHELAHHLTRKLCERCPDWFHEGFAEYYSSLRVQDGVAQIGRAIDAHGHRIRSAGGRGVTEVLLNRSFDAHTASEDETRDYYARSWALVYCLLNTGQAGREALDALLTATIAGKSPEQAVRDAFGMEIAELDETIATFYVKRLILPFTQFPIEDLHVPEIGAPTASSHGTRLERLATLDGMLKGDRDPDGVEEAYRSAIEADPGNARAHAGLASFLDALDRCDEAHDRYETALALAPTDPAIARAFGIHLMHRDWTDDERLEISRRARSLLARGLAGRPMDRWALASYGATWIADRETDPTPGIAALETAASLEPDSRAIRHNLLVLLVRNRNRPRAAEVAEQGAPLFEDGPERDRFLDLVLGLDLRDAKEALDAGRVQEAEAILRQALERAGTDFMRELLERTLAIAQKATAGKKR